MVAWAAALNAVSGVAFLAFAAFLLRLDPGGRRALPVSLFLGFWGAQIVAVNAPRLTTSPLVAEYAALLSIGCHLPVPLLLARAVAIETGRASAALRYATTYAVGSVAVGTVLVLWRPRLLLQGVAAVADGTYVQFFGPAYLFVAPVAFFAVLVAALFSLSGAWRTASSPIQRRSLHLSLVALALYAGYVFPENLAFFAVYVTAASASAAELLVLGVAAAGTACVGVLAARHLREARGELDATRRKAGLAAAAALLVPAAAAVVGVVPYALGGGEIELLGAFRLLAVALLFYGVLKFRLFGIDVTLRRAAPALGVAAAPFVVVPVALALSQWAVPAVLPVVLAVGVAAPLPFLAHRAARRMLPQAGPTPEYLQARRIDVYRAALETGHTNPAALAARLGLTAAEQAAVQRVVQAPPSVPERPVPGTLILDTYEVQEVLHEGPNGATMRCRDVLLQRDVVVKPLGRLDGGAVPEGVLREGRVAAALEHPRLVRVHKVERTAANVWLVMEFAPGGTLESRLARGPLPVAEAVETAAQVLEALSALHGAGVVHRDVAPQNIFFDSNGAVKLGDFGLARLDGAVEAGVVGTPGTVSPEVAGGAPATPASDLYSAAAVTYRCLVGTDPVPLAGRPLSDALRMVRETPPLLPVKALARAHNEWLARGLAKEPASRFPSAAVMRSALLETVRRARAPAPARP